MPTRILAGQPNEQQAKSGWPGLGRRLARAISFPVMLTGILITFVLFMSRGGVHDPDIWWHLRNAEYLLKFHQLPNHDMYSFTVAGHDWINHEWLADIPFYIAWRLGGLMGLKVLAILLVEAIFLGLLYLCYRSSGNFKASVLTCCYSVFLAVVSFGPRTILFGYGYLVVLLIILERFRSEGRGPLWIIPPLFCLWVNTHGSWLLGLIVFGIVVAAGLIQGQWGRVESVRWNATQLRQLLATGLASVVALFVNPYGWRLVVYPFDLAYRQKLNIAHVEEWVSVNFHDGRGKIVIVLLIGLLLAALLRNYRWKLAELGLVVFALYCSLTYIRFLFLAAILVTPVLAKILDFLPPYRPESDQPLINALFLGVMLVCMVRYFPTRSDLELIEAQDYPTEILPYLRAHPPAGRMLNFYAWGGFLGWYDRDLKIFIDSRADIFEYAGVFQDYIDLMDLLKSQNVLDKHQIRYVLFPPNERLTYLLGRDPRWTVLYRDKASILLERELPKPAAVSQP